MARGRMLNNSICRSLKFDQLPDDTCRLLATWTISHLDKNGVFYGDPVMVKSLIFPRRADISIEQIEHYLDSMRQIELIVIFEAEGQQWQFWPGFTENQVGLRADRESSDFPTPPGPGVPPSNGTSPDTSSPPSGNVPANTRNPSGNLPAESEVESESESEVEEREIDSRAPALDPQFSEICNLIQTEIGLGAISSATVSQEIQEYLDLYGLELLKKAVQKSKQKKAKTWNYVRKAADTLAKSREPPIGVVVCQENGGRPPQTWWDDVDRKVGQDEAKLTLLAEITKTWVGFGYKRDNIIGILDCFDRGELPAQNGAKNGQHNHVQPGPGPNSPYSEGDFKRQDDFFEEIRRKPRL